MSQVASIDLLHGEKVDVVTRPHALSFARYHLFAAYLFAVAAFLAWFHSYLITHKPLLDALGLTDTAFGTTGIATADVVLLVLFWVILLLSGFGIGVLWVSKAPLVYIVLVGAAGTALEILFLAQYESALVQGAMVKLVLLCVASVISIVLTEVYRRGHVYVITNYRIVAKKGFIGKEEREIMYDKITDIYVSQGILGRIFNFGTVIPVSSSGFGLGEDSAQAFIASTTSFKKHRIGGGFSGGRSVQRPRAATYFSLHGIPNPKRIRIVIGNRQLEAKEAPVLRRIENALKEGGSREEDYQEP